MPTFGKKKHSEERLASNSSRQFKNHTINTNTLNPRDMVDKNYDR